MHTVPFTSGDVAERDCDDDLRVGDGSRLYDCSSACSDCCDARIEPVKPSITSRSPVDNVTGGGVLGSRLGLDDFDLCAGSIGASTIGDSPRWITTGAGFGGLDS